MSIVLNAYNRMNERKKKFKRNLRKDDLTKTINIIFKKGARTIKNL